MTVHLEAQKHVSLHSLKACNINYEMHVHQMKSVLSVAKCTSVAHSTTKPVSTTAVTADGSDDSNGVNQNKSGNDTQSNKCRHDNKVAASAFVTEPSWEPFFLGHVHYAKYDPHNKACDACQKQHNHSYPARAKPNAAQ